MLSVVCIAVAGTTSDGSSLALSRCIVGVRDCSLFRIKGKTLNSSVLSRLYAILSLGGILAISIACGHCWSNLPEAMLVVGRIIFRSLSIDISIESIVSTFSMICGAVSLVLGTSTLCVRRGRDRYLRVYWGVMEFLRGLSSL